MFEATDWIGEHVKEVKLPLVVLHSSLDKVTNPKISKKFVEMAGSDDKVCG